MFKTSLPKSPSKMWLLIPREYKKEFKVLYWSLILFFISELFCGIETYILMHSHDLVRIMHSLTSSLGMGLFSLGLYMIFDKKVLNFGQIKCFMIPLCQECTERNNNKCKYTSVLLICSALVVFLAIPPFFASTDLMKADPTKYILPFEFMNSWFDETLLPLIKRIDPNYTEIGDAVFLGTIPQIFHNKVMPGIVIVIQLVSFIKLKSNLLIKRKIGIKLMMLSIGMLSFCYYDLILERVTGDLFIGAIGHEFGELLYLLLFSELLIKLFGYNLKVTN